MEGSVTEWDAQGNPIQSAAPSAVTEWDADGNPIQPEAAQPPTGTRTPGGEKQPGDNRNRVQRFFDNLTEPDPRRQEWQSTAQNVRDAAVQGTAEPATQLLSHPLDTVKGALKGLLSGVANISSPVSLGLSMAQPIAEKFSSDQAQGGTGTAVARAAGNVLGTAALGEIAAPVLSRAASAGGRVAAAGSRAVENFKAPARAVQQTAADLEAVRGNSAAVASTRQVADTVAADTSSVDKARQAADAVRGDVSGVQSAQEARDTALSAKATRTAAEREAARRVTAARMADAQAQQDAELAARQATRKAQVAAPQATNKAAVSTLQSIADSEEFPKLQAQTIRDAVPELAEQYRGRATTGYQTVEKKAGGEIKSIQDAIYDTTSAIKANKLLDPAKAAEQAKQLEALEARKAAAIQTAVDNGLQNAQEVIRKADADWRTYRSLQDYSKAIRSKAGEIQTGGIPSGKSFAAATDSTINKGRLPNAAAPLKDVASKALLRDKSAVNALRGSKDAGRAAKVATSTKTTEINQAKALFKRTNAEADDAERGYNTAVSDHERSVQQAEREHARAVAEHDREVARAEKMRDRAEKVYQQSVTDAERAHDAARQRLSQRNRRVIGALSGAAGVGAAYRGANKIAALMGSNK